MVERIEITVRGIPAPGGSKTPIPLKRGGRYITRANGSPIITMIDDAKGNREWRKAVASAGHLAVARAGLERPMHMPLVAIVDFFVPRPASHFSTGRFSDKLRPDAPPRPAIKPDATKLWRSTEDALTGIVWVDDGQIIKQTIEKFYVPQGHAPGAVIVIEHWQAEAS